MKGSSINKGKIFDQEGSAMDPIDVEPLRSAPPASLVPYGTSEDEFLIANGLGLKENSPIEIQSPKSPNLGDNRSKPSPEIVVPNIKTKENMFETSPVEKHDS